MVGETQGRVGAVIDPSKPAELAPEVLAQCLAGLEVDYKRGIVVIDDGKTVEEFKAALVQDRTAGNTWETVKARLLANDKALLKRAAKMQGGGELIGVDLAGKLVIVSRGDGKGNREPERYAFRKNQVGAIDGKRRPKQGEIPILINTDTPNREGLMCEIGKLGLWANYWEIRDAVHAEGLDIPPDAADDEKRGIVAAVEAVTGKSFVCGANKRTTELRGAILDCGDTPRFENVRIVQFAPLYGHAYVRSVRPWCRNRNHGAVRVLRG